MGVRLWCVTDVTQNINKKFNVFVSVCVSGVALHGIGLISRGGHKPGKPGILRDFSEHGSQGILTEFREFCATSGKNGNKQKYF